MVINNQRGQTLVEYILLLAVAVSLVLTFYQSATFKKLFGSEGSLGTKIKTQTEFSYRHAFMNSNGIDVSKLNRDGASHPSYYDDRNSGTRFFGAKKPYQ